MSDLHPQNDYANGYPRSASRPGSPTASRQQQETIDTEDTVTCQWDNCGIVFTHLPTLIEHIHNADVDMSSQNTLAFTNQTILVNGQRVTEEASLKPRDLLSYLIFGHIPGKNRSFALYQSFTRSDALAKHMRLQHNIEPPAPGRGGSRKRKRDEPNSTPAPMAEPAPPPLNLEEMDDADINYENFTRAQLTQNHNIQDNHSEDDDTLPPSLRAHYDQQTDTIYGRPREMVMYILMKAKLRYAMEQNGRLHDELVIANEDLQRERSDKERLVDKLLRVSFGDEANHLIAPMQIQPGDGNKFTPPPPQFIHSNGHGH
ncbi:hypothetical protein VNI00_011395 [Paramarasmius palmivorus]|uniref:C2H2-type domain-containing protein n=1 Tax=Paramarasmius palmivorus TaxID=297713 RepID=A0AAW0CCG1_9AGAR